MQQPAAFAPYVQGEARPPAERAGGHAQQSGVERLLPVEERRGRGGERRALSAHHAGAAGRAAGARAEPLAVDPVLAAAARRAHSAAQRPGEHAVDLSSAVARAGAVHVPGRQRDARLEQGPGLAVRRHHRARSLESQRADASDPAVRRVAPGAYRRKSARWSSRCSSRSTRTAAAASRIGKSDRALTPRA